MELIQNPSHDPVVIARNISVEEYEKYCTRHTKLPVLLCLMNGAIVAYEVPSGTHGKVIEKISWMIARGSVGICGTYTGV